MSSSRRAYAPLALLIVTFLSLGGWSALRWDSSAEVVVGVPEGTSTSTSGPSIPPPTTTTAAPQVLGTVAESPEPPPAPALAKPDGAPWPPPVPFVSSVPVPDHLVFVLVIGSDARPGQDPTRARADSLHLLAVNPATSRATIVGLPRDSWVDVPGHGHRKINSALVLGGPDLMAQTVRTLTGLPIHYYVVTGFDGFTRLVDELGGVDVAVERRMNDRFSGARFEPGWHHFNGGEALAFSRNRKDSGRGDFSRSENQGLVLLSALAKMRAEVGDDAGVAAWTSVLVKHVALDVPPADLPGLGALARVLDPHTTDNVVAPGGVGRAGGQSVVFLDPAAATLFDDLRDDAVIGG